MSERKWHKVERLDPGKYGKHKYVREEDFDALSKTTDALYEALEELLQARWMVSPDWCDPGEYDAVCDKARAALALARGEQ